MGKTENNATLRNISQDELKTILERHYHYVRQDCEGWSYMRANLSNVNLTHYDLSSAVLEDADLSGANLTGANLLYADLLAANLQGANLTAAGLCRANLSLANLSEANLSCVNISNACLLDANLIGAKNIPFIPLVCPDHGAFVGFKKARFVFDAGDHLILQNNAIVKLEIPADAKRSSGTTRKCRCNKAKVIDIQNLDGTDSGRIEAHSIYDMNFIYRVGEMVSVDDFDEDRWNDCSTGIHFFINRQEAVEY